MKTSVLVLVFCFLNWISLNSQVAGSGKVPVLIKNKPAEEIRQDKPVISESPKANQNKVEQAKAAIPDPPIDPLVAYGNFYALIIGINNYHDPDVNDLDFCIRDAESFYNTLISRYTFDPENVKLLKDASYDEIMNVLDYFAKVVKPEDNFLIFYAGHGYWIPVSELGFWLPSDAQKTSRSNWFRNSALRDYLREINSRHTLLITDACFSGSIFKTRNAFSDASVAINKLYELPSRKAMTSGTLTEVPDQSAFLRYMIDRLIKNEEKYLSSEQLFSNFRMAVINNSRVIPQFGVIQDVGDEGGDFIFILR